MPGFTEGYQPVRYVRQNQICAAGFCFIPAGAPGSVKGSRGNARAFFDPRTGLWCCLECFQEGTRADLAREAAALELPGVTG